MLISPFTLTLAVEVVGRTGSMPPWCNFRHLRCWRHGSQELQRHHGTSLSAWSRLLMDWTQLAPFFLPTHIPRIIYVGISHVPRIICMRTWWEFPPNCVGIACKKSHFGTVTHVYPTHICPRIIYAYLPTFYNLPRALLTRSYLGKNIKNGNFGTVAHVHPIKNAWGICNFSLIPRIPPSNPRILYVGKPRGNAHA